MSKNRFMKRYTFFLVLFLFSGSLALAQGSMIAGKLTDEQNDPIAGATIRVSKAGRAIEATTDNEGLFYTQLLAPDMYRLDVIYKGQIFKAHKIYLAATKRLRKFYYLQIVEDNVRVTVQEEDPFLKSRVGKLHKSLNRDIYDPQGEYFGVHIMKYDSTSDKLVPLYASPVPPPRFP